TVEVHDFYPGLHEVLYELASHVVLGVELGERTQFGVGAEHQVHWRAGPLHFTACAVTAFIHPRVVGRLLPHHAHVDEVHEEVITECAGTSGEDTVLHAAAVGVEGAQAANQHCHFRNRQVEQVCLVHQGFG